MVFSESDSSQADRLRVEFKKQLHELLAPDTFLVELAHALTRAERRGVIRVGQGALVLGEILTTPPHLERYVPLLPRAIDISSQARIGVYNCLYIALAERESCPLLTADERLASSFTSTSVLRLAAF
jgi:predicted nucleic acid-binding protein